MTEGTRDRLAIPALRAHMGDWVYYVAFMKMKDVAERVGVAEEIHESRSLNELIQRQLTDRASQIRDYLLRQPQRFFNALVIGVYGGEPEWYELAIRDNEALDSEDLPRYVEGALGLLALEGTERLFAIDGQHRVMGIREAVESDSDVGEEEISALFVAHRNDAAGLRRTRRLFSTLNRYAKPVSKLDIIALDEDDVVAISTRSMVEEHPLFKEKVALVKGKNMPVRDEQSFTTIVALYDALDILLPDSRRGWNDYKRSRPAEDDISGFHEKATGFWDAMTGHFSPLRELSDSQPTDQVAGRFRNREGGHLLFRPVGLLLVVKTVRRLIDSGAPLESAVRSVSKVPMELDKKPWVSLLWDATNKRMITASENQRAAEKLLFYAVDGDLSTMRTSTTELRSELAGLLNVEDEEAIELRSYVQADDSSRD